MKPTYSKPAQNAQTLIQIIQKTDTGRTLMERISPRLGPGLISIEQYPTDIFQEVKAVLPEGHPIGACYFENDRKIFVDFTGPAGIVAAYLAHEFALVLEGTEKAALETQVRFTHELAETDDDYAKFMAKWTRQAGLLADYMNDDSSSSEAA